MRRCLLFVAMALFAPPLARGADLPSGTTEEATRQPERRLFDTPATFSPYVGMLGFANGADNYTISGLFGVTFELFLYGYEEESRLLIESNTYYGVEFGLLNTTVSNGEYVGLLPILFKGRRRLTENLWVEGSLGAELLYRTRNDTMTVGRTGTPDGHSLTAFPSLGASLKWKLTPGFALSLRAEYIPTPAADMFTASLGGVVPVG
jgi:hypothetical protein